MFPRENMRGAEESEDIGHLRALRGLAGNRNGVTMEDILKVLCCT